MLRNFNKSIDYLHVSLWSVVVTNGVLSSVKTVEISVDDTIGQGTVVGETFIWYINNEKWCEEKINIFTFISWTLLTIRSGLE
jgi:hypothetical protein